MKVPAVLGLFGIVALPLLAQNTMTIEGVVVDTVTGAGISGSAVRLTYGEVRGNVIRIIQSLPEVVTNGVGSFRVSGLKPGDYMVMAQKQGYFSTAAPQFFHLNADGSPTRLRVELTPFATVRGRVFGIDGQPVRATIDLGPGSNNSVSTNEEGYFTFEQLAPGSYTLLGRPAAAEPVSSEEGTRTEVVPTYYPSALERTQAELITVRAGAELSGYEIRLQSVPVYRVSGIVLDPAGRPASDAVVQLLDRVADGSTSFSGGREAFSIRSRSFADRLNATRSTTTGEDGVFEFPSVRTGDWTIRVESDLVRDEIQQRDVGVFGSTAISLGRGDLDDLRIHLAMAIDLSGTVEGSDASPAIARAVAVSLTGESGYFGGTAHPDVNGALRFEDVIPGRFMISAESTGDYYASVLLGSSDVTGQTIELGLSSPPIRVVLKRGGTIRWTLEQSSSWAVVLIPRDLTGVGYSVQSRIATNAELTGMLTGIPPGEYYAIALDRFDSRTMADTPHLRELAPKATSVRVEQDSVSFVQLKINHFTD
jgi:Carboxypeptidase regulatory-like domain